MTRKVEGSNPRRSNSHANREAWLDAALDLLKSVFSEHGHAVPDKIRCAVGFTGQGRHGKLVGEVWPPGRSAGGYYELYVRPDIAEPVEVLAILVSLVIIMLAGDGAGRGQRYAAIASEVGLMGTKTAPCAGVRLMRELIDFAERLGPLPHDALDISVRSVGAAPKQTTRMVRAKCPACPAIIRMARATALQSGWPICGKDQVPFEPQEGNQKQETVVPVSTDTAPLASDSKGDQLESTAEALPVGRKWTAQFASKPPLAVTGGLRKLGGDYKDKIWSGTAEDTEVIRALVAEAGGEFRIDADGEAGPEAAGDSAV